MGEAGELTGVEMADGNAVITITVNEQLFNIDALKANPDLLHRTLVQNFCNPTDDMKALFDELRR